MAGISDSIELPTQGEVDNIPNQFHRSEEAFLLLDQLLPRDAASSTGEGSSEVKDSQQSDKLLGQFRDLLDEFQEQPYLLDPFLERLVEPPLAVLQAVVRARSQDLEFAAKDGAVQRSAKILYFYTKVRGYKAITSYFPHEVSDVVPLISVLLRYVPLQPSDSYDRTQGWELRYILLLWLSLVCMIPFDLQKFDNTQHRAISTTDSVLSITKFFLDSPGKERDAAALTLGKVLQRQDVSKSHLAGFIDWCQQQISPPAEPSAFLATGVLATLCELCKSGTPAVVIPLLPHIQTILSLGDHETADSPTLQRLRTNSLVNRYRCKLACRMGLKLLRPRKNGRGVHRRVLGEPSPENAHDDEQDIDQNDVPEEIDGYVAQLLNGLEDRDTIVRFSAAKGLARICERLPEDFIDQVAETITRLFEINVLYGKGGEVDLSLVSESTWQGACLALAELGRRGLLNQDDLVEKLHWVHRALFLDIRRGSYSKGSAVRDAACYVIWSLSRAYSADAIRSHATTLAQGLLTVALLDRDVSIRRAASAAFQECVGRLAIFPHGIEMISKTDFFSIGVRRQAILECMPAVAVHTEYRQALLDHLMSTTVTHWDAELRSLGSQGVAHIVRLDFDVLASKVLAKMTANCSSRDTLTLHGSLLTLAELAGVSQEISSAAAADVRDAAFRSLDKIPQHVLSSQGTSSVIQAACKLVAVSVTPQSLEKAREGHSGPCVWEQFVEAALSRKEEQCHTAAAEAVRAVSLLQSCDHRSEDMRSRWKGSRSERQQACALALGSIRYTQRTCFEDTLTFLTALATKGSPLYSSQVETRRNSIISLVSAVTGMVASRSAFVLPPHLSQKLFSTLTNSLEDYTVDQRGDVGSWVRLAAIEGLTDLIGFYRISPPFDTLRRVEWLSDNAFHDAVAEIAKQMTERMDSIRAKAALHFLLLYQGDSSAWHHMPHPHGEELVKAEFAELLQEPSQRTSISPTLKDAKYLFPRTTSLLLIPRYRVQVLRGLVHSMGTRTELSHRVIASSLIAFATADHTEYPAKALLADLLSGAEREWAKSAIAVPTFQSIAILLEDKGVVSSMGSAIGSLLSRALALCARSIDKVKAPPRLLVTLQLAVSALAAAATATSSQEPGSLHDLQKRAVELITTVFLSHEYPTVRADAAERLYLVVSELGIHEDDDEEEEDTFEQSREEAEDILLSTPWAEEDSGESSSSGKHWQTQADRVGSLLQIFLR